MAGKAFKEKQEEIDKTISYIARFDYLDPRLAPKLGLMRPKADYLLDIIAIYDKAKNRRQFSDAGTTHPVCN